MWKQKHCISVAGMLKTVLNNIFVAKISTYICTLRKKCLLQFLARTSRKLCNSESAWTFQIKSPFNFNLIEFAWVVFYSEVGAGGVQRSTKAAASVCVERAATCKAKNNLTEKKTKWNIARGTTDPEIDSVTWTKFGSNMATLALVANLATRCRHLH